MAYKENGGVDIWAYDGGEEAERETRPLWSVNCWFWLTPVCPVGVFWEFYYYYVAPREFMLPYKPVVYEGVIIDCWYYMAIILCCSIFCYIIIFD